jgi:hypothetical protein
VEVVILLEVDRFHSVYIFAFSLQKKQGNKITVKLIVGERVL